MKRYKSLSLFVLCSLLLGACNSVTFTRPAPTQPPASALWALGDTFKFTGTIVDWAKGDAIAPSEGIIFGDTFVNDDFESIALGLIKEDASFVFEGKRGSLITPLLMPSDFVFCSGLKDSVSGFKLATIDVLNILPNYVEGVHARPGGGILISSARPIVSQKDAYTFAYANKNATVTGTCDGVTMKFQFHKGWNSIKRTSSSFITAALPKTAKWYFINPLTAEQ